MRFNRALPKLGQKVVALRVAARAYLLVPQGRWLWAQRFDIVDASYVLFGTSTGALLAMLVLGHLPLWFLFRTLPSACRRSMTTWLA